MMQILKAANLLLAFLLELFMLAAFAYWGFNTGPYALLHYVLGIGTPLIVAVIWGVWMAPSARRRLRGAAYLAVKVILFAAAAAGLYFAGQLYLAVLLAVLFVINQGLIYIWNQ
jgi:hypothetical protein